MGAPSITPSQKRACAERELRMRQRVYPRWVAAGKMTRGDAEREIAAMAAIAADYAEPDLFEKEGGE